MFLIVLVIGGEIVDKNQLSEIFTNIKLGNENSFKVLYDNMKIPVFTVAFRITRTRFNKKLV